MKFTLQISVLLVLFVFFCLKLCHLNFLLSDIFLFLSNLGAYGFFLSLILRFFKLKLAFLDLKFIHLFLIIGFIVF